MNNIFPKCSKTKLILNAFNVEKKVNNGLIDLMQFSFVLVVQLCTKNLNGQSKSKVSDLIFGPKSNYKLWPLEETGDLRNSSLTMKFKTFLTSKSSKLKQLSITEFWYF